MIFSHDDLVAAFSRDQVDVATTNLACAETPAVLRDGEVVSSIVRDGPGKPKRVYIRVSGGPEDPVSFEGECSCGERNCRHALIVLAAALEGARNSTSPSVASAAKSGFGGHPSLGIRLLYVLLISDTPRLSQQLRLHLYSSRVSKDGGYGKSSPFRLTPRLMHQPPGFLQNEDLAILEPLVAKLSAIESGHELLLSREDASILRSMLSTGRCFLENPAGRPLRLGKTRVANPEWKVDANGDQWFRLRCKPDAAHCVALSELFYIDNKRGTCGSIKTDLPVETVVALEDLSPVSPEQTALLRKDLPRDFADAALPLPVLLSLRPIENVVPEPELHVLAGEGGKRVELQLGFRYGDVLLRSRHRVLRGKQVLNVTRAPAREGEFRKRLQRLSLSPLGGASSLDYQLSDDHAARQHFLLVDMPRLASEGWRLELDPSLGLSITEVEDTQWVGSLQAGQENDWFTLDLGIDIDGEHVSLLPAVAALIHDLPDIFSHEGLGRLEGKGSIYAPLPDGRLLPIPVSRLRRLLETLLEFYEAGALNGAGTLKMGRWHAGMLAELQDDVALSWRGGSEIIELARQLRSMDSIPQVAPPDNLLADLRPYQRRGLDWLQFMRRYGLGGILADDMGLGKTLQTLAHILLEKTSARLENPCLIVAPTSLLFNWLREAERFAPSLKAMVLHGPGRKTKFAKSADHDLLITSYGLLLRDEAFHAEQHYHLLVLDEAQSIKNAAARTSQVVRRISASQRLCLSGTPMENHLGELWSLFDFLMPGFLGGEQRFKRLYREPIEKQGDEERGASLARRIRPYLLRRVKSEVAGELPALTEIVRTVELEGEQRELYESIRLAMHRRVRQAIGASGIAGSSITILDALLKLRQACCDPRLVKLEGASRVRQSAKLELVMDILPEMIEEGRRILLFSQFTSMLDLIQAEVEAAGIAHVRLTGQTRHRADVIERFQQGKAPLFLISLKAGGTGLNLTAADTVIHYDPWWNPAAESQATGRAHRIGQQNPIFAYKLIAAGTVEEKIREMQQRKKTLADALYTGKANAQPQWSEEDVENLFQPLP